MSSLAGFLLRPDRLQGVCEHGALRRLPRRALQGGGEGFLGCSFCHECGSARAALTRDRPCSRTETGPAGSEPGDHSVEEHDELVDHLVDRELEVVLGPGERDGVEGTGERVRTQPQPCVLGARGGGEPELDGAVAERGLALGEGGCAGLGAEKAREPSVAEQGADVRRRGVRRRGALHSHGVPAATRSVPASGVPATPVGSSAYSMAAGGSLLAAGTNAFVCTPLAMHGGCAPPLVVPDDREFTIEIDSGHGGFDLEVDEFLVETEAHRFSVSSEQA